MAPPVAPLLIGRPEPSERDTMIELKWKGLINQSSAMLCISNFIESKILICNVDIKSRSREIKKEISTTSRPTVMFQITDDNPNSATNNSSKFNEDYLLVGTEGGKLELYQININEPILQLKRTFDAHPGSAYGVTTILPLVDPSELITNESIGYN